MKFANDEKRLCLQCRKSRALFEFRGRIKRDKDHTLCFRCYAALCDATHARRVALGGTPRIFRFEETSTFFRQALEQPASRRNRRAA